MTVVTVTGAVINRTRRIEGSVRTTSRSVAGQVYRATREGGAPVIYGDGLKYDAATRVLSVDTAQIVEEDNTRPVSSGAVYAEIGNIEVLLAAL